MENICRICTIKSDLILYKNIIETKIENEVRVCDALTLITNLEVKADDECPQCICMHCEKRLQDAFHLRLQAISTAKLLMELKQQQSTLDLSLNESRNSKKSQNNNPTNDTSVEEPMCVDRLVECQIETEENVNIKSSASPTPSMSRLKADEIRQIIHGDHFMVNIPSQCMTSDEIPISNSIEIKAEPKKNVNTQKGKKVVALPRIQRSRKIVRAKEQIKKVLQKKDVLQNGQSSAKSIKLKPSETKESPKTKDQSQENENQMDAVSFLIQHDATKITEKSLRDEAYLKRKHQCEVCGKRFVGKSNLIDHLRYHANVKPFECTYCERKFVQAGSLRCHLRTHTREKPYICNICEKPFSQPSGLKVHIRTHTNERNYVCPTCTKAFISKGDLTKHQRIHDSVKKFICDVCDWGFSQKCNLTKHHLLVHSKKDAKEIKVKEEKEK